ncbi:MAG: cbb3-type cytochrome oxidase assembly protein CcoS [Planctomycetota bacterium]|nr:cbb3-type cytochrome oxidase assembly protein CcoS [Planctomycetota bacterium]
MDLVFIALPLALGLATFALIAFVWAARSGQFDDLETPSRRLLLDDQPAKPKPKTEATEAPKDPELPT